MQLKGSSHPAVSCVRLQGQCVLQVTLETQGGTLETVPRFAEEGAQAQREGCGWQTRLVTYSSPFRLPQRSPVTGLVPTVTSCSPLPEGPLQPREHVYRRQNGPDGPGQGRGWEVNSPE